MNFDTIIIVVVILACTIFLYKFSGKKKINFCVYSEDYAYYFKKMITLDFLTTFDITHYIPYDNKGSSFPASVTYIDHRLGHSHITVWAMISHEIGNEKLEALCNMGWKKSEKTHAIARMLREQQIAPE